MKTIWFLIYMLDPTINPVGPFDSKAICEQVLADSIEMARKAGKNWGPNHWECHEIVPTD